MLAIPCLFAVALMAPQEPLRIGVIAAEDSPHIAFVRGVQRAAEAINKAGGVAGAQVQVVWHGPGDDKQIVASCKQMQADGVHAVIAPIEVHAVDVAKKAIGSLPLLAFDSAPVDIAKTIDRLLEQRLCMTRVGLVVDPDRSALAFGMP